MTQRILSEKITLREGNQTRRVSKAEALVRTMFVGAMKGDPKAFNTLRKMTLESAQYEEEHTPIIVEIKRFAAEKSKQSGKGE